MPNQLTANKRQSLRGFTLIELAIVVLIIGLVLAGAIQLTTSMQQQRGDQTMATDMRTVVAATQKFLNDNQAYLSDKTAGHPTFGLGADCSPTTVPAGTVCKKLQVWPSATNITASQTFGQAIAPYLPTGVDLGTSTNPKYYVGIARLPDIANTYGQLAPVFRAIIVRKPDQNFSDTRLSRIASLLGTQGGILSNVSTATIITGNNGTWTVTPADYGLAISTTGLQRGSIAGYTVLDAVQMNTNQISRITTGNPEANTMRANLSMGGNGFSDSAFLGTRQLVSVAGQTVADGKACAPTGTATVIPYKSDGTGNDASFQIAGEKLRNAVATSSIDGRLYQCQNISGSWMWRSVASSGTYHVYADPSKCSTNTKAIDQDDENTYVPYCTSSGVGLAGNYYAPPPSGSQDSLNLAGNTGSAKPVNFIWRAANFWYWNNTGAPLTLMLGFHRKEGTIANVYIREAYSSGGLVIKKIAMRAANTDGGNSDTITVVIPPDAIYAVAMNNGYAQYLRTWSEYY